MNTFCVSVYKIKYITGENSNCYKDTYASENKEIGERASLNKTTDFVI